MARIFAANKVFSTGTTGVTSKQVVIPVAVTAGSLIVVAGHMWRATDPTGIAVTDSASNSYTTVETGSQSWSSGVSRGYLAYAIAATTATITVTVTSGGSTSFINILAFEVGEVNATPLDVDGGESSGTSTTPSDGITTVANNAIVIGLLAVGAGGGTQAMTPGAGITEVGEVEASDNAPYSVVWKRVTAAGATTISWTTGNVPWKVLTRSFKG